jgi:hypothetical protein
MQRSGCGRGTKNRRVLLASPIRKIEKIKIISGGQTGVDRGALDAALDSNAECGGWCPAGRLDENGRIPERYPLTELLCAGYSERTARNVADSDGTLIIYAGALAGGTRETVARCVEFAKSYVAIDLSSISIERAIDLAEQFVSNHQLCVLNVAGTRASEWSEGYSHAYEIVTGLLRRLSGQMTGTGYSA